MAVSLAVLFLCGGCETDPASTPIRITPSAAALRINQSASFSASGGYDYTWSLSDASLGYLSTRVGPTTVYTSTASGGADSGSLQVLTVTSSLQGEQTGGTGSNAVFHASAEAHITHL